METIEDYNTIEELYEKYHKIRREYIELEEDDEEQVKIIGKFLEDNENQHKEIIKLKNDILALEMENLSLKDIVYGNKE